MSEKTPRVITGDLDPFFHPLSSVGAVSLPKTAEIGKRPCMYRTGVEGHGTESRALGQGFQGLDSN